MNCGNNLPKVFKRFFGHVVVAEGNIEIHVTSRCSFALWARAYCTEFDLATVETKCPCHVTDLELKGRTSKLAGGVLAVRVECLVRCLISCVGRVIL